MERPCIVCARDAAHAQRLLRMAEPGAPIVLLCIRPTCTEPAENARFAEEIYRTARAYQAEMALLFSDYPEVTAAQFIRKRNAGAVILGTSEDGHSNFVTAVRRQLPRVKTTIPEAGETACCFCTPGRVSAVHTPY